MDLRPLRLLRAIDRQLDELSAADRAAQEVARIELARSATRYSRRTKRVVDETMTLSATLVRAGEVEEANRLMAEVEREVRTEEAALIETVNEVKVAGEVRRRRLLKLKLVKAIATAGLSGSMFMVSAFGVVLARSLVSDDPVVREASVAQGAETRGSEQIRFRDVVVGPGIKLRLTHAEAKKLARLTESMDAAGLRRFLAERVPSSMLDEVHTAILTAVAQVLGDGIQQTPGDVLALVKEETKETPKPSDEASPSEKPSPSPSEEPTESPTPAPTPNSGDGPSDGDGGEEDESPLGNLPLSDDDEDQG